MRLLHTQSHRLCQFSIDNVPPFAVFSSSLAKTRSVIDTDGEYKCATELPIPNDVKLACKEANNRGISYLWAYSSCVDKSSSADIDEAINASFRWLGKAAICLAYLDDLPSDGASPSEDTWKQSAYWKSPWTLQELIAPKFVEFFDASWQHLGSKASPEVLPLVSNITGIPENILLDSQHLWASATAMRLAWAADRQGHREEDVAYSLVGLVGVSMSSRYGEGAQCAFSRLQKKIMKETTDGSIFAWRSKDETEIRGVFANSPSEFRQFIIANGRGRQIPWIFDGLIRQNNRGLEIRSRISRLGSCILMEIGRRGDNIAQCERIGIWLREWNGAYVRVNPTSIVKIPDPGAPFTINLSRHIEPKLSNFIKSQFDKQKEEILQPTEPPRSSKSPSPHSDEEVLPRSKYLAPVPSGAKRDRSGRPKLNLDDNQKAVNKYVSPLHTPSVYSPNPTDNGGERSPLNPRNSPHPRSEEEKELSKDVDMKDTTQDTKQEFENLKLEITQFCYSRMQEWMRSDSDNLPLDDTMKPRKRARTENEHDKTKHIKPEEDNNGLAIHTTGSPGPDCSAELTIEHFSEFWGNHGNSCVKEYLLNRGLISEDSKHQDRLTQLTLLAAESLREMVMPGHGTKNEENEK